MPQTRPAYNLQVYAQLPHRSLQKIQFKAFTMILRINPGKTSMSFTLCHNFISLINNSIIQKPAQRRVFYSEIQIRITGCSTCRIQLGE